MLMHFMTGARVSIYNRRSVVNRNFLIYTCGQATNEWQSEEWEKLLYNSHLNGILSAGGRGSYEGALVH